MRIRERIPKFIEKIDEGFMHKLFLKWFNTNFEDAEQRISSVKDKRRIKKFWMANHDLRFSQVLVNMGYIENIPGLWYYEDDDDLLLSMGYPANEVLFWGQNYDKDMNRLDHTNWIPIKNMKIDHIKAVIAFMGERLPVRYKDAFDAELKSRGA